MSLINARTATGISMPAPDVRTVSPPLPISAWIQTQDYVFGYPDTFVVGGPAAWKFWAHMPYPPISVIEWNAPPAWRQTTDFPFHLLSVHPFPARPLEFPRDTLTWAEARRTEDPMAFAAPPITAMVAGTPAALLDARWALVVFAEPVRMYAYEAWIPRPQALYYVRCQGPEHSVDLGKSCFLTVLGSWTFYR